MVFNVFKDTKRRQRNEAISDEEKHILDYMKQHDKMTKNEAAKLLGVSASTATRVIRGLVEKDLLRRNGRARSTYYTLMR